MEKIKLFIKIVIEILVIILIYVILSMTLKEIEIIKWLYFIIFILAIVYLNLDEIKKYFKKENKDKELFNTYYINYPKVFEIAMLINNKIKITAEESYKKELQNKENYSTEGSISLEKIKFGSKLGNEFSEKIGHEYKEVLPPPLLSRFTLKSFFENPNNQEKLAFIEKRINKLLSIYRKENLQPQITAKEIKENLDYETINKIADFRVINRIIISALTKTIDNAKNNIYKKTKKVLTN